MSKVTKTKQYQCRYCNNDDVEDFDKRYKTICYNCTIDQKAIKNRQKDKEIRIAAVKLILEEFKTLNEDEEIVYSEVGTGTLTSIVGDISNLIKTVQHMQKTINKLKKKVEKLESK